MSLHRMRYPNIWRKGDLRGCSPYQHYTSSVLLHCLAITIGFKFLTSIISVKVTVPLAFPEAEPELEILLRRIMEGGRK